MQWNHRICSHPASPFYDVYCLIFSILLDGDKKLGSTHLVKQNIWAIYTQLHTCSTYGWRVLPLRWCGKTSHRIRLTIRESNLSSLIKGCLVFIEATKYELISFQYTFILRIAQIMLVIKQYCWYTVGLADAAAKYHQTSQIADVTNPWLCLY